MLKHFAVATVVLTGMLAVFASGEDWGARAQVQAVEAKNQLAATEAEKLGTKKVATTLKIANNVGAASFGNDEGGNFGGGGGGGGGYAPPVQPQPAVAPVRPGQRKAKSRWSSDPLDPTKPPQPPGSEQEPAETHPSAPPTPTAQDIARITASSAHRSGGSGSGD
jgi:hypothetical protein